MSCGSFRYLFGPVASRRFGRSLGVDLLGQRVCSFDCVFCEAGPTQTCTLERAVYVPTDVVLAELRAWLGSGGQADVITLAGRGEPTLHRSFGVVIDAVHDMCSIPVVLLSNGSLFHIAEVRRAAAKADIVKVSLSVWDDASLSDVNRPAVGLRFADYLSGMITFRDAYKGELRLEVMFIAGVNTGDASVEKLAACAAKIGADTVELNTVVRPPSEEGAGAVTDDLLLHYAGYFGPNAVVIGRSSPQAIECDGRKDVAILSDQVMGLLARRGCTRAEIAEGLGCSYARLDVALRDLLTRKRIRESDVREDYFCLC